MNKAMNWITGLDRQQTMLLPERLEDYVGPDNPVRVLEAFVESLSLDQEGFAFPKEDPLGRGRPAFHPAVLLKLYLYGYTHGIRSSRRLEAECVRNLEVIWLMQKLRPDFKTIADFRKTNRAAFKNVLRQFTSLCRDLELFGGELLAVDGTKIKASNNPGRNFSQSKLRKHLRAMEERIEGYLKALDEADAEEAATPAAKPVVPGVERLREKLAKLRRSKEGCQQRLAALEQAGESQVSLTDPDSRAMGTGCRSLVGYNVQTVVDSKHKLIVESAVTNATNDLGQLAPMAAAAQKTLGVEKAAVVADTGYYKSEDIKTCQDAGLEPHVARGKMSPSERKGLYGKSAFGYDAAHDVYHCPAGQTLERRRASQHEGKTVLEYDAPKACATCRLKGRCTESRYRTLTRWEHEERLERMAALLEREPTVLLRRKTLVEHPYGTIKERILVGGFLLRGLEKVGAEVSLAHWAYNFKRVVKIVGVERLLEAIGRGGKRPPGAAGPRGPRREPTRGAKREHFHFHFRRAGRSECRQMFRRVYFILRPVVSVSLAHETNRFSHSL